MRFVFFSVFVTIAACCVFVLASNHFTFSLENPNWQFPCISYAPTQETPNLEKQKEIIRKDLEKIANVTSCIRTYSYVYPYYLIPNIANELNIEVIAGIWIEKGYEKQTQEQIDRIIADHNSGQDFKFIVVGNETVLHNRATSDQHFDFIQRVKSNVSVPVTTAEPSGTWLSGDVHEDIVREIDFISINMLPFWYGFAPEDVLPMINSEYRHIKEMYPARTLFVSEIGWPSFGPRVKEAIPNTNTQHQILGSLKKELDPEITFYNVIEAFDTPWKMFTTEGLVGAHWGIFTNTREEKNELSLIAYATLIPNILFAFVSSMLTLIIALACRHFTLRFWFFALLLSLSQLVLVCASYLGVELYTQYITYNTVQFVTISVLTLLAMLLLAFELFSLFEIERLKHISPKPRGTITPFISIHIPTKNESPEILSATILSCLGLAYPAFEIIVVSNNCTDERIWRPTEALCAQYQNVHFYHHDNIPGYKSGALNFALMHTDERASWIAVVDADYIVTKDWLTTAVQYVGENTAAIQTPQHYRSHNNSFLEKLLIAENNLVFNGGSIPFRDHYKAPIQHGTMCLIKKEDLISAGTWSLASITEDADLGLRLIAMGKEIVSVPRVCGSGLAPQNVQSLLNQRFRWAYGATRICIDHAPALFSLRGPLNWKQKLMYIFGWMPWFILGLYPPLITLSLLNLFEVIGEPKDFIPGVFYLSVFLLLCVYIAKLVYICFNAKIATLKNMVAITLIHAALTPTIALSIITACVRKTIPFKSTHSPSDTLQNQLLLLCKHFIRLLVLVAAGYGIVQLLIRYTLSDSNVFMLIFFIGTLSLPLFSYYAAHLFSIKNNYGHGANSHEGPTLPT